MPRHLYVSRDKLAAIGTVIMFVLLCAASTLRAQTVPVQTAPISYNLGGDWYARTIDAWENGNGSRSMMIWRSDSTGSIRLLVDGVGTTDSLTVCKAESDGNVSVRTVKFNDVPPTVVAGLSCPCDEVPDIAIDVTVDSLENLNSAYFDTRTSEDEEKIIIEVGEIKIELIKGSKESWASFGSANALMTQLDAIR